MCASMSTSIMLFRAMFHQLVPPQVQTYIIDGVKYYWKPKTTSKVTLVIPHEFSNDMFYAAEIYLTRITPDSDQCLRITKSAKEDQINVGLGGPMEIVDSFEGIPITWNYYSTQEQHKDDDGESYTDEKKRIELKFDKNYKDTIILSYLPSIINKSQEIKNQKKVVQIHSLKFKFAGSPPMKQTMKLDHPSTFDTLAMDPKLKKSIIDDLDLFVKRRDFYKKVGKAWKRGYLLYGPPGTGKSSLIAAMANYLKFDIYDLQLSNVQNDSTLKDMLLYTSNRSILVIEDIDCSVKLPNRKIINAMTNQPRHDDPKHGILHDYNSPLLPIDCFLTGLRLFLEKIIVAFSLIELSGMSLSSLFSRSIDFH
ncbi:AAA+ ATPase domain-containing protein [Tanacetum coccineum]